MIKSKKELMLISFLGLLSSVVSYVFTILMLMSFAETPLEKVLYFLCGVINDGVKWFSLITLIKYYRAKLYKNFIGYCILFSLFFGMSLTASISFSVFTVQKQMYTTLATQNDNYTNLKLALDKNKSDLDKLEIEKNSEIQRVNKELDGLPLDHITRREQLSTKKIDLTIFYDLKIDDLKLAVAKTTTDLESIKTKETVTKTLKDNAIASFFSTMARVTHINIDNVILSFAVALGVILDVASIALTFDSSFSYQNKREFNKDQTNLRNVRLMKKELESQMGEGHYKIFKYDDFIKYADANGLDILEINYNDMKDLISRSSFYNYLKTYKETLADEVI